MNRLLRVVAVLGLLVPLAAARAGLQGPGRERLILKDGSYQVVLKYEVNGDRVRFRSAERGDWEEMPTDLVDWKATAAYNHEHDPDAKPDPNSPAAQAAAEIDRAAAAEKADEQARQPEVGHGLRLPDESGVWGFDTYKDTPELIRIRQSDGDLNLDLGHSVKAMEIPRGGARDLIRLPGYKAAVSFHVPRPVFYIALDTKNPVAREDAMVVDTHGASSTAESRGDKNQQASASSTYALVHLRIWKDQRAASGSELRGLSTGGEVDGSAEIVATERTILPGGHWMRVTPRSDLNLGQYSLIEILPGGGFNQDGWDFGVNPMAPENKGAFAPLTTDSP